MIFRFFKKKHNSISGICVVWDMLYQLMIDICLNGDASEYPFFEIFVWHRIAKHSYSVPFDQSSYGGAP